jgi:transcriptional regulator with XRE-family HTH domain
MSKKLQEALGRTVRLARVSKGLSQEHLAQIAGVDRTYISGLERGIRNPSLATIEKIAKALDSNVAELFKQLAG